MMSKRVVTCPYCLASIQVDVEEGKGNTLTIQCLRCSRSFDHLKEHRKSFRYVPFPRVRIGPFGYKFDDFPHAGSLLDISITGMRIKLTSSPPEQGEPFNFKVKLPPNYEPITTSGRVVWVKTLTDREGFEFGVEFIGLDYHNRKLIESFLSTN